MRLVGGALALLLTPSCSAPPSADEPAVTDAGGDATPSDPTDRCFDALVPSGLGFGWASLNHRISRLDLGWSPTGDAGCGGAMRGATLAATFVGGNFTTGAFGTDQPFVLLDAFVVGARAPGSGDVASPVRTIRGRETLDLASQIDGNADNVGEARVVVPLPAGLDGTEVVEPFLDAISLHTDVPQGADYPANYAQADGYTTRGIAFAVDSIVRDAASVSFTVRARFGLAQADRPDMNAAIPHARTRAAVGWQVLVLGGATSSAAIVAYRQEYPAATTDPTAPLPPVPSTSTATSTTLPGAPTRAIAALRSFSFALSFPEVAGAPGGDYMREYSARIEGLRLAEGGRVELAIDGYASNAGVVPRGPTRYDFAAEAVVVGWSAGPDAAFVPGRFDFTVPSTTAPMALAP